MGNSVGGRKRMAKVMKINGETMKVEAGTEAGGITREYPNHVVLESEAVKHFGIRATPLTPDQKLDSKKLYFLLELPQLQAEKLPRRVRSGIVMSAKDRLESLMLSRRSSSDLSILKQTGGSGGEENGTGGRMRVKMRLPRKEVEKLMRESGSQDEASEKLMDLCMEKFRTDGSQVAEEGGHERAPQGLKAREKKVSFHPQSQMQIDVAS